MIIGITAERRAEALVHDLVGFLARRRGPVERLIAATGGEPVEHGGKLQAAGLLGVVALHPFRIVADRVDDQATGHPVAAGHLGRQRRHRHRDVHEGRICLGQEPGAHPPRRFPQHQRSGARGPRRTPGWPGTPTLAGNRASTPARTPGWPPSRRPSTRRTLPFGAMIAARCRERSWTTATRTTIIADTSTVTAFSEITGSGLPGVGAASSWVSPVLSNQVLEGSSDQAEGRRVLDLLRSEGPVEADRGLVPVEYGPRQTPTATCGRHPRNVGEELTADPTAAPLRLDVQILEIETGLTRGRRERGEVHREPNRLRLDISEDALRGGPRAKQRLLENRLGHAELVREPLVVDESLDHPKDDRRVALPGGLDSEGDVVAHGDAGCSGAPSTAVRVRACAHGNAAMI